MKLGNAEKMSVAECSDVILNVRVGSTIRKVNVKNEPHVPSFKYSLISVKVVYKKEPQIVFSDGTCKVTSGNAIVTTGKLIYSLYAFDMVTQTRRKDEKSFYVTLDTWHERLAHVNRQGIEQVVRRGVVRGVQIAGIMSSTNYNGCAAGKAHRVPIPITRSNFRANGILDFIHSDLCRLIEVDSIVGARYFITFIDDRSNGYSYIHLNESRRSLTALSNFKNLLSVRLAENFERSNLTGLGSICREN